jgi:SPP1 gp7 family putative phage head morphogenesis protein
MIRRWKTTGLWATPSPREALTEAAKQRSRVLETWLRARGVRLDAADETPGVDDIIRQNVSLISKLKRTTQAQVARVIRQANAEAWTRDKLSRALSDRFAIAERHAVLIARDQIGKLNGAIVQRRSEELGIKGYIWVTSADQRVRPIHRRLNNTKHTWDKPPVVSPDGRHEHPGGDFQCRCTAEPDLSEILDEPAPKPERGPLPAPKPPRPAPEPAQLNVRVESWPDRLSYARGYRAAHGGVLPDHVLYALARGQTEIPFDEAVQELQNV